MTSRFFRVEQDIRLVAPFEFGKESVSRTVGFAPLEHLCKSSRGQNELVLVEYLEFRLFVCSSGRHTREADIMKSKPTCTPSKPRGTL